MGWKDRAIELFKRCGTPAKFVAKMVLGTNLHTKGRRESVLFRQGAQKRKEKEKGRD